MKYILTFLMLIGVAYAQEPTYTPMKGNYKFKGIRVDTLFLVPSFSDTASANATYLDQVAGAMIRCGNDFWMRNAATTAWLQNVNVGSGANPTVQYVDSIYRKSGKDSIYWRKGGVTSQFKDSIGLTRAVDTIYRTVGKDSIFFKIGGTTYRIKDSTGGGGGTDSPDRIDGSATGNVKADMTDFNIVWDAVDTFRINNNNKILIYTDTLIQINKFTNNTSKTSGYAQFGMGRANVDITSNDDTLYIPGTYTVIGGGSNLYLPDATKFAGQTFYIINTVNSSINLNAVAGNINDAAGNGIGTINGDRFAIFTSDGTDWWGYNAN